MDWEFGISRCKLLYTEWINNKVLLYSTGNYIQYPVINHKGKEIKKNVYMCITESLCCRAEINTTSPINCTSIKKKVAQRDWDQTLLHRRLLRQGPSSALCLCFSSICPQDILIPGLPWTPTLCFRRRWVSLEVIFQPALVSGFRPLLLTSLQRPHLWRCPPGAPLGKVTSGSTLPL